MPTATSDKIIKNTFFNYAGYIWRLLVSFFLVAYIVAQIGKEEFGIFVLLEAMVTCLALLDPAGVEGAFVKYIAEYHTKNEEDNLNHIINIGFSYYFTFQLALCLLIFAFSEPLLRLFKFDATLTGDILFLLGGFLLISLIRGSMRVFRSTLLGLQRMDVSNLIDILITIPNVAGTILFLSYGWGLKGLIINGVFIALFTVTLQTIWAYRLVPTIRFRPFYFNKEIFRKTFIYGINIQVARISEVINNQIDKILLGLLIAQNSTILVGFYELGSKPARALRDLAGQFLPAILPAASHLDAMDDEKGVFKLYYLGSKYLALMALPLTFFTVSNASLLIQFWLGPGYEEVAIALQVLSIGYMFFLLAGMARLIARGIGYPQFEMQTSLLITILNVVLSALLIIKLGLYGALLGTTISIFLGSVLFMYMFHKHIGQSFWIMIGRKVYTFPVMSSIAAMVGSMVFNKYCASSSFFSTGRLDSFLVLLCNTLIFFAVYTLIILTTDYLEDYDRELFKRCWQAVTSRTMKTEKT